jgi:hypothetical protein
MIIDEKAVILGFREQCEIIHKIMQFFKPFVEKKNRVSENIFAQTRPWFIRSYFQADDWKTSLSKNPTIYLY